MVRALIQRQYLDSAATIYLFDTDDPTPEQSQRVQKLINEINEHNAETISAVDSGVARAMEFSLFPPRATRERLGAA